MQKIRAILSVLLILAIALVFSVTQYIPAGAATVKNFTCVALGDSIIAGYGLSSFTSNDINNRKNPNNFSNKLSQKMGLKPVNLGVEGSDQTMLLHSITNPKTQSQKQAINEIKAARLITISIGGNSIFKPVMTAVNDKLVNGKTVYNASVQEIQLAVFKLISDKASMQKLEKAVSDNAARFTGNPALKKTGEFSTIITRIKQLNPKAQIVVLTVYNPYNSIKALLPSAFITALNSINNEIIKQSASGKNYKVADVYSAFSMASQGTALENADLGKTFDPHPTAKGHDVIYTVVYEALNNKLPYNVNNNIIKGKVSTKVSTGKLYITVTPDKGYKLPESILIKIGDKISKNLKLQYSKGSLPISDISANIQVSGKCTK